MSFDYDLFVIGAGRRSYSEAVARNKRCLQATNTRV
jgi:hypothetical protein